MLSLQHCAIARICPSFLTRPRSELAHYPPTNHMKTTSISDIWPSTAPADKLRPMRTTNVLEIKLKTTNTCVPSRVTLLKSIHSLIINAPLNLITHESSAHLTQIQSLNRMQPAMSFMQFSEGSHVIDITRNRRLGNYMWYWLMER